MTPNVISCGSDTTLSSAAGMMWDGDCGVLPVVENGKLSGIITDRDICIALGTRDRVPHTLSVRDVETTAVMTCAPEDELRRALEIMRQHKLRRIPVVDSQQQLKGVITLSDIVSCVDGRNSGGLSYEDVVQALKAICAHSS